MTLSITDLSALIGQPPPANAGNANLGALLGTLRNAGESGFRRREENRAHDATVRGQDQQQARDKETGRSNIAQEYDQKIRRDENTRHHLAQEQAQKAQQAENSRANRQNELNTQKAQAFQRRKLVSDTVMRLDDKAWSTNPNVRAQARMAMRAAGMEVSSDKDMRAVLDVVHDVLRETADPEAMRKKGSVHDPDAKVQGQRLANEMREADILQDEVDPRDDGPRGDYAALGQENVMPGDNPQAPLRDERGEPMSPNDMTIPEAPNIPVTPEEAIQRHQMMQVRDQMGEDKKREGQADLQSKLTPDGQGGGLAEGEPGQMPMQEAPEPVTGADRGMSPAGGTQDFMADPQGGQRQGESRDEYLERERAGEPAWGKRPALAANDFSEPTLSQPAAGTARPASPLGGAMFFEGEMIAPAPPSIEEIKAVIRKNAMATLDGRHDEGFADAVVAAAQYMDQADALKMAIGLNEKERDRGVYGQKDSSKGELDELRKADIRQRMEARKKDMRIKDAKEFRSETTAIRQRMNVRGWDENKEGLKRLAHFEERVMNGNSAEVEDAYRQVMKMSMPGVATDKDREDLTGQMDFIEGIWNKWTKLTRGEVAPSVRAKMAKHISQMQKIRMRAQMRVFRDFKVSQARAEQYGPREKAYRVLDRTEFAEYDSLESWKEMRRVEKARLTGGWTRNRDDNPATRPFVDPGMRSANKADPSANTVSSGIQNLLRKR